MNNGLFLTVRSFQQHLMLNISFVQAPVGKDASRPGLACTDGQTLFSGPVATS